MSRILARRMQLQLVEPTSEMESRSTWEGTTSNEWSMPTSSLRAQVSCRVPQCSKASKDEELSGYQSLNLPHGSSMHH